jgi:hypothetical protein
LGLDYCGWEMFLGLDRNWAHRKSIAGRLAKRDNLTTTMHNTALVTGSGHFPENAIDERRKNILFLCSASGNSVPS